MGNSINLCLNRFKLCHIDPASHTYELDVQTEDGKPNEIKKIISKFSL